MLRHVAAAAGVVAAMLAGNSVAGGWPEYGGDKGGMRYSPLTVINRDNVAELAVAWQYRTGEPERRGDKFRSSAFQNTPILVATDDAQLLVVCTPFNRVIALDPATGEERWAFDAEIPLDHDPALIYKCRGVTPYVDTRAEAGSTCRRRLFMGTADSRLIAIDTETGKPCADFGDNGSVEVGERANAMFPGELHIDSPPTVVRDTVVVGQAIADNVRADAPRGTIRAYDARSGAAKWIFETIPQDPNDPAMRTWSGDSAKHTGHANVWSIMSADEERDMVFLPTGSASPDFYGGARPGENRYANSVVALRGSTGELVWHFQVVHHDIWDYDLPAQPVLVDIERDGEKLPAVVQTTKQGFIFVLHRETGKPLFPVEERPVPQDPVPGEWLSPTQPFPVLPKPLVQQGLTPDDAWGFTFWDRGQCRDIIAGMRNEGLYTPPSTEGTILMPGWTGGANWPGPAFDPGRQLLVVATNRVATRIKLVPKPETEEPGLAGGDVLSLGNADTADGSQDGTGEPRDLAILEQELASPQMGVPYAVEVGRLISPWGAPCTPPPWGGLTAVDLTTGEFVWDVTLGSIERFLPVPIPWELGTPIGGGPIVTQGGLVFIAATMDQKFRAFDLATGETLWTEKLPAGSQTTPMTYEIEGRQYVVIASGGHAWYGTKMGDYVTAYALPE